MLAIHSAESLTRFDDVKRKFPNHRQWREFIATIHETVKIGEKRRKKVNKVK